MAVDGGVGDVDAAATNDAVEDAAIEVIEVARIRSPDEET